MYFIHDKTKDLKELRINKLYLKKIKNSREWS